MAKIDEIQIGSTTYDVGADASNVAYGNTDVATELARIDAKGDGLTLTMGGRNLYDKDDETMNLYKWGITPTWDNVITYNGNFTGYLAKIPIEGGKDYIIYHDTGDFRGSDGYGDTYVFLDANGTEIDIDAWSPTEGKSTRNGTVGYFHVMLSTTGKPYWEGGDEVIDQYHRRLHAPVNAAYLVLSNDYWHETLMVEQGNVPSEYADYDEDHVLQINDHPILPDNQREKKFDIPLNTYIAGDSIATFSYGSWNIPILNKFSFKNYRNVAIGGCRWGFERAVEGSTEYYGTLWGEVALRDYEYTKHGPSNVVAAQIYDIVRGVANDNWEEPELIVIHCGINDIGSSREDIGDADTVFGFWNDGYGISDFTDIISSVQTAIDNEEDLNLMEVPEQLYSILGGMRYAIELLWTHFPYCKVVVTTPFQVKYNASGAQTYPALRSAREQMIKAAAYLSVDLLDFHAVSGVYAPFALNYLEKYMAGGNDGVHPYLMSGGRKYADVLGRYLIAHFGGQPWYELDNSGNLDNA